MTLLSAEMLETVVNRLEGQCRIPPEQALEEQGLDPTDDRIEQIDERIFCCEECGWYCSTDELNNDDTCYGLLLCDDCHAEREEPE